MAASPWPVTELVLRLVQTQSDLAGERGRGRLAASKRRDARHVATGNGLGGDHRDLGVHRGKVVLPGEESPEGLTTGVEAGLREI